MDNTLPKTNKQLKKEHGIENWITALGDLSEFMLTHDWPLMLDSLLELKEKNPLSVEIYAADAWAAATKHDQNKGDNDAH